MATKIAYYDDPQYDYQRYWQSRQYENEAEKICLRRIFKLIPKKRDLIDIGAGFGRLAPLYASCFDRCFLIDPSEKLLFQAKNFCRKYKNVFFKKGFVENMLIPDNSFDVALMVRALHHLKNPGEVIKKINRIVKPGGYFILEFANKFHFKNCLRALFKLDFSFFSSHQPRVSPFLNYHPNQIKTLLLANGFKIIKTFSVSNLRLGFFKKLVPLRLLLVFETLFFDFGCFGPSIFILSQKNQR